MILFYFIIYLFEENLSVFFKELLKREREKT